MPLRSGILYNFEFFKWTRTDHFNSCQLSDRHASFSNPDTIRILSQVEMEVAVY